FPGGRPPPSSWISSLSQQINRRHLRRPNRRNLARRRLARRLLKGTARRMTMNSNLFQTFAGRQLRAADARNSEGAPAHEFDARHALAQYAATGCLHGTFYATAEMQLENLLALCDAVPAQFIAKTAVYARERGHMKDMPAVLV